MFSPSLIDSTSSEIDVESSATKFNLLQKKTKKKEKKIDRVNVNEFDSSVCPNVLSLLYWICIRAIAAKTLIDWYQLITFLRTNSRNWFEVTSLGLIDSIIKKGSPDYWSIDRTLNTKKKKKKKKMWVNNSNCCLNWISGIFCSLTLCQMSICQHGTCQSVNGTQSCACDSGFTGSLCETSLSPCDLDPCQDHGKCVNTEDGFICQCNPWWQGKSFSVS